MTPELIDELVREPRLLYRHTVDEYERMIESGLIEEGAPFELLEGQIVRKIRNTAGEDLMTVGDQHTYVVMKLEHLCRKLENRGCHYRAQQPIALPPSDEPEPDGAIVRGTIVSVRSSSR